MQRYLIVSVLERYLYALKHWDIFAGISHVEESLGGMCTSGGNMGQEAEQGQRKLQTFEKLQRNRSAKRRSCQKTPWQQKLSPQIEVKRNPSLGR